MFGIMGAHRTGKTTLAKALSRKNGIYYFQCSTTEMMAQGGFNPVGILSPEERIEAQEWLLLRYLELAADVPRPFITDRTPLDMAAYTLAEVSMHNTSGELGERIDRYVKGCLMAAAGMFDTLMVARPLPSYDAQPDKPPPNPAFQAHIQILIEGMAYHMLGEQVTVGFLTSPEHDHRVEACTNLMTRRIKELQSDRQAALVH